MSRSREGAWIEIAAVGKYLTEAFSRSREGAWIEILFRLRVDKILAVAPVRERGLKL